jgi:hypothetical protein
MLPLEFLQKIDPTPEQVLQVLDLWPMIPIDVELICEKLGLELEKQFLDGMKHHAKRFIMAMAIGKLVKSSMNSNSFAVELLMPKKFIFKYIDLPASQVAQIFDVTPSAAEIRLVNL